MVSPGTFSTVAVTVWLPADGAELSCTWVVYWWPGTVCGVIAWPLTEVPLTCTLTTTLVSLFWPSFVKAQLNVGGGFADSVFVPPTTSGVPLTVQDCMAWPWIPGAGLPFAVAGRAAPNFAATNVGVNHWMFWRNWPDAIGWP